MLKTTHLVRYRAGQFFVALKAYLDGGTPANNSLLVNTVLPLPAQQQLFKRMAPNDRRHALAVVQTLTLAQAHHPALLQAALLHDAAKSIGQPLPYRVFIVLLEAFWPAALQRLAAGSQELEMPERQLQTIPWWRRPFVVHALHPTIGAAWAKEVGCEPLAVWLIASHQDEMKPTDASTPERALLSLLQWADNKN